MLNKLKICVTAATLLPVAVWAQTIKQDEAKYPSSSITPIFSQVLITFIPKGFEIAFANASATDYIHELIPKGENVSQWTQMLTVTGAKDIALNPQLTPQQVAGFFGAGFQSTCPNSFNAHVFPNHHQINGHDSVSIIVSCGTSKATQGTTSEIALITVIKGKKDYYTIQWAERGSPSTTPIQIDLPKWSSRLEQQIKPIKLCTAIAGEKAPYPSCLNSIK